MLALVRLGLTRLFVSFCFSLVFGDLSRLKISELNDPLNVKRNRDRFENSLFNDRFIVNLSGNHDDFKINAIK